jgi:hypothetical protein
MKLARGDSVGVQTLLPEIEKPGGRPTHKEEQNKS